MKITKDLLAPPTYWAEITGMRRCIKVLKIQAWHLRQAGMTAEAAEMNRVARAISDAAQRENPVAESESLGWFMRPNVRANL
jgi:hypothetical protein